VLRGVNFEFNKDVLTINAKTLLDQVADALLARTDIKFEIGGHTDAKGTDDYNQSLSERRAASVKSYLVGRGVDAGRITSRGYGESVPIGDNATEEGAALNRRVELKVIQVGGVIVSSATPVVMAPVPAMVASNPKPVAPVSGGSTVTIANYTFTPATLTVAAGTTVTWTNADPATHVVVFSDGDHALAKGGSYSRAFNQPGEFAYSCGRHPDMAGKVVVM
jgi:OOP family OmpA-OmpF porin